MNDKTLSRVFLLNIILLIVLNDNAFSQNEKIFVNKDYVITTQKFNFKINDTIVDTYLYLRPNGTIDFNKNSQDTLKMVFGRSIQNGDSIINLHEKYVEKSKDTIFLKSYFSPLLTHDSSLLNYSEYPFDSSNLFYYEMKYSTILSNFNKPRIADYEADTVIRIILPIALYDTCILSYSPAPYSIMELTIKNGTGIICLTKGQYDTSRKFIVTSNKSYELTNNEIKKTIKRIQQVDFSKEYCTAVVGFLAIDAYFIEIKLNDNYYAFERALYYGIEKGIRMRDYPDRKCISKLYENILSLKVKLVN